MRINTNATPLNLTGNLVTGGILMGTGTGANDQLIAGPGNLQGTQVGAVGKNLAIYQANPAAKLTISAVIANNAAATTTPATALSKAGPGTLVLSGTNTYTGVTYFNGGAISVGAVTAGAVAGPLGASSNASANWVFNGGTLQYTGATGTTDHGATFNAVSAIDVTQRRLDADHGQQQHRDHRRGQHAGPPAQDRRGRADHRRHRQRYEPQRGSGGGHLEPRQDRRLCGAAGDWRGAHRRQRRDGPGDRHRDHADRSHAAACSSRPAASST